MQLQGGLQLGSGTGLSALPVLGVTGLLSSTGDSTLIIQSNSSWTPTSLIPELVVPRLLGNVALASSGALVAKVNNLDPISVTLPGPVSFRNWDVDAVVDKACSGCSANLTLTANGEMEIGSSGLTADITGHIDTAQGTVTATLNHQGGWQPLPGVNIVSPALTGSMVIGGSPYMTASIEGTTASDFDMIPGLLTVSALEAESADGPILGLGITKASKASDASITVTMKGRTCVQLSNTPQCMPVDVSMGTAVRPPPIHPPT